MQEKKGLHGKFKKWHQRWWGFIFLFVIVLGFIYVAVFLYEVIAIIEISDQMAYQQIEESFFGKSESFQETGGSIRSLVETKDDPFWGPIETNVAVVIFCDFQCPFCRQVQPILKQIRTEYKDKVKIIYRDFPNLASHPLSLSAAIAAECADDQNIFWPYHDLLFLNQDYLTEELLKDLASDLGMNTEKFNQCLEQGKYRLEVLNDLEDAIKFGVNATPTFFINGNKLQGIISYNDFKEILDYVLKNYN